MNPRLQIAAMCLQGSLSEPSSRKLSEGLTAAEFIEGMCSEALRFADALIEQEEATRPKCKKCNGHGVDTDSGCPYCGTGVER